MTTQQGKQKGPAVTPLKDGIIGRATKQVAPWPCRPNGLATGITA